MINYPYLLDKNFLREFDLEKHKVQFVKISILDFIDKGNLSYTYPPVFLIALSIAI